MNDNGIVPNAQRLLWAGFMAILAAGVGFAIRGGIFDNWQQEYNFSATTIGAIGGAGFTGFCFGIILGGIVADIVGYRFLVIAAFACHVISALVTFSAAPGNAEPVLFWGMFIFAFANGTLEAVANPLVATIFPNNRTHYLNILHASWPAGMVIGVSAGWLLDDLLKIHWKLQLALYLIPTVIYGLMFMGQAMPKSEASEKGADLGKMFKDVGLLGGGVACILLAFFFGGIIGGLVHDEALGRYIGFGIGAILLVVIGFLTQFSFGSFLLFVLFITHALVGAVELGTDGWIQNITGNLFNSEQGKLLFFWTSAIMFGLRFCAEFIEKNLKLNPVALLLVSAVLAAIGLNLASVMNNFGIALLALGVYALGKTFFWPTMLAVASDRFPRSGAVAISVMGGIGMLSAGIIGGPGLGYLKDSFSAQELNAKSTAAFEEFKADKKVTFLNIPQTAVTPIDAKKLGEAKKAKEPTENQKLATAADQVGDRKTLAADSYIPATMAAIYLLILLWFKTQGGYRRITIEEQEAQGKTA